MADDLDVYRDWLGIESPERPLDHYQLLRLKPFEDDTQKIRAHYRKLNAQVRKYASGQYGAQSQALLNELAKAMLCLTDTRRKAEYDASLGRKEGAQLGQSLEEILIRRKVVDTAQLDKARNYAAAVGVEVREALVQQKLATADVVMQAYAESVGVPFIDLEDIGIDVSLVPRIPARIARHHSCAPVMIDDEQLFVASPNLIQPDVEEELRLRLGMQVRTVLCTPQQIHAVIEAHFPRDAVDAEPAPIIAAGAPTVAGAVDGDATTTTDKQTAKNGNKQPSAKGAAGKLTPEEIHKQQQQQIIPIIAGLIAFTLGLFVLNFIWSPFRTEQLGIGMYGAATAAGVAAIVAAVAWVVMSLRR